jgi:hypothetical protein
MNKEQTVKWLIEDFNLDNGTKALADAVRKTDFELKLCDEKNLFNQNWDEYYDDDACVVCVTSIQSALSIIEAKPNWKPGPWGEGGGEYECTHYYKYFMDHLFNDNHIMFPLGHVERQLPMIREKFMRDGCFFIRPSGGTKSFTGQIIDEKHFESDWNQVTSYDPDMDEMIVISTPKQINAEYRFVVTHDRVIASSQYKTDDKMNQPHAPEGLVGYVTGTLKNVFDKGFRTDPVWILDVALDADNEPYVLEIGSFSASGLYSTDKDKIVEEVSEIAYREYIK